MLTNMTSKGQVTIPRDVRRAVGLVPGKPVVVEMNDRGEAVVRPGPDPDFETRLAEVKARMREAQRSFRDEDQWPGIGVDEWYLEMRGPPAEV